jgi:hypothetical protein
MLGFERANDADFLWPRSPALQKDFSKKAFGREAKASHSDKTDFELDLAAAVVLKFDINE